MESAVLIKILFVASHDPASLHIACQTKAIKPDVGASGAGP